MIGMGAIKAFVAEILRSLGVNVGTNADAASATGSVHAKLKDLKGQFPVVKTGVVASDTLQASADTAKTSLGSTMALKKKITAIYTGIHRVYYEYLGTVDFAIGVQVYKNGEGYGTYKDSNSTSWLSFSEDLFFAEGNSIELWAACGATAGSIKNFRIYYSFVEQKPTVVLN